MKIINKKLINILVLAMVFTPLFSSAEVTPTTEDTEMVNSSCVNLTYYMSQVLTRGQNRPNYTRARSTDLNTMNQVTELQSFLSENGFLRKDVTISGKYGALTAVAVKKFQTEYGISPTGATGPLTRTKIAEISGCNTSSAQTIQQASVSPARQINTDQSYIPTTRTQNVSSVNMSSFINPHINFDSARNYFTKGEKIPFTWGAGSTNSCEWYTESVSGGYKVSSLIAVTSNPLMLDTSSPDFKTGETYRVGLRCNMGMYGNPGADTTGASSQVFEIKSATEPSCTVGLEGNNMYRSTEQITANITSSNLRSVRFRIMSNLNTEVAQYQDFSTLNGVQTFPSGMLTPGVYIAEVEGVKSNGDTINCMPTPKLPFSIY